MREERALASAREPNYRERPAPQDAPFVYRLGRQPFTLQRRVRFPQGAPTFTTETVDADSLEALLLGRFSEHPIKLRFTRVFLVWFGFLWRKITRPYLERPKQYL